VLVAAAWAGSTGGPGCGSACVASAAGRHGLGFEQGPDVGLCSAEAGRVP